MKNLLLVLLSVALGAVLGANLLRDAHAQPAVQPRCTPVLVTSLDLAVATVALERAIAAHVAEGRQNVSVHTAPPASGFVVCGW